MPELTIKTSDNRYTYTSNVPGSITQQMNSNHLLADTQGFKIKKQIGDRRISLNITINDTSTNATTNLLPQLNYPTYNIITIDRNLLNKNTQTGSFVLVDYAVDEEFDNGAEQLIKMKFIEIV